MTATTARDYVADQVEADNPDWAVDRFPAEPAQVKRGRPYVAIWRSDLNPGSNALELRHDITLHLYAAKDTGDRAEEELEGSLDAVLLSLQRLPLFTFTSASRTLFKSVFQGWEIKGHITRPNHYRSTIIQESETP